MSIEGVKMVNQKLKEIGKKLDVSEQDIRRLRKKRNC